MAEYREVRDARGVGGKIMAFLFWGWNVLMVLWLFGAASGMGDVMEGATTSAEQTGAAAGATIGIGLILFFWVAGTVILAIPFVLTRGPKRWVEKE